jgi:hypothetical protein
VTDSIAVGFSQRIIVSQTFIGTLVPMLYVHTFDQFGLKPGKDVILIPLAEANGN